MHVIFNLACQVPSKIDHLPFEVKIHFQRPKSFSPTLKWIPTIIWYIERLCSLLYGQLVTSLVVVAWPSHLTNLHPPLPSNWYKSWQLLDHLPLYSASRNWRLEASPKSSILQTHTNSLAFPSSHKQCILLWPYYSCNYKELEFFGAISSTMFML
jgi:hypothetical protein